MPRGEPTPEYGPLEDEFDLSHLDEQTKKKMVDLILEYKGVFVHGEYGLGSTDVIEHHIDVQGSSPIKRPPSRVPHALRDILRKAIDEMVEQKVI